jgi:alpha-1,3-rhamnosyl/mannosyltransferase
LAVDSRAIWSSGIGRYTREIVRGLSARKGFARIRLIGAPDELNPFVAGLAAELPDATPIDIVPLRGGRYSAVAQAGWAKLVSRGGIGDVVLFPHWDVPMMEMPKASVVTVHDLIHIRVKSAASAARRALARAMIGRAVDGAARIITDSAFTRTDLIADFPAADGRAHVVPLAAAKLFSGKAVPLSAISLPAREPYLLCVANRKPHKNLDAAVEVFARLAERHRTLSLVFAGEKFRTWKRTLGRINALGLADRVVDLDVISDESLHALYAHSAVYLHPSCYEGFGFPILEAMASGAPVVASSRTAIPEVAGTAATLVDPDDVDAMAAAVDRVLMMSSAERKRAAAAGRAQAALFSWARTAEETEKILLMAQ